MNIDTKEWRNPIKNADFQKNLQRTAPSFANINLLGACNVDCYFCLGKDIDEYFKKQNQVNTHFSEWKNFEEYIEKCKQANIPYMYVTGQNTDSLVYKHLDELIDYLQDEHNFEVGIRTNGYLSPKMLDTMRKCKRSVGLSIHSLNPDANDIIMKRRDIPDWDKIIPSLGRVRVSIVLNRHNVQEFDNLVKYISKFDNVKYIQVRRICTDTREDYLIEDVKVYEEVFDRIKAENEITHYFYNAECFNLHGKEVVFWRTVKTTIDSFNYYTDGTINDEYFVIEGYMRDSANYPKEEKTPIQIKGLEGYWRDKNKNM
jgi:MoaA/NifB/PqqE/SkfB family radical SAM enzyme